MRQPMLCRHDIKLRQLMADRELFVFNFCSSG
jgi:hypothetical protein